MIATDKRAFAQVVLGFAELKGKQLSRAAVDLYWAAMRDWELEEFQAAAVQLLKTCEFMPGPKDFEDLRKASRPTAGEAFAMALSHACSGAWRNGPLGDRVIDRAVRSIGGYVVIAMGDEDKNHFLERRFAEHYEAISDANDTREALPDIAPAPHLDGPRSIARLLRPPEGNA